MNVWEKLWGYLTLFLLGCIGFDDCNVYLSAFNFILVVTVYPIYFSVP